MLDDAEAACRAGAFGLFVPKTVNAGMLHRIENHIEKVEKAITRNQKTVFIPMIEDRARCSTLARLPPRPACICLVVGSDDLATAMGAEPTPEVLRFPKLMVLMAAKAAGCYRSAFCSHRVNSATLKPLSGRHARLACLDSTARRACIQARSQY